MSARAPGTAQLVDLAFTMALIGTALFGFGRTYGGTTYLLVGGVGIVLGSIVALVAERLGAPVIALAAVTVAVFFLSGGGVALAGRRGFLPTPSLLSDLANGAVRGWNELLTVLPPAGATGNLMTIPYLLGLVATVATYALARRLRRPWPPVLVPVLVLALSILFGTDEPSSVLVQGTIFGMLALGWLATRGRRNRQVIGRSARVRSAAGGAALVALAGVGGTFLGPQMPLAGAQTRVVLRDQVQPPFDPHDYASPLSQFRKYALPGAGRLRDEVLFDVRGLPAGALLRIAVMDSYDGTVWNVTGAGADPEQGGQGASSSASTAGGAGYFQRVGESIPTTATGARADVDITIKGLGGVWLPTAGVVTAATFGGPGRSALDQTFRYNLTTDAGVSRTAPLGASRGLQPGDSYRLSVILPPTSFFPVRVDEATAARAGAMADGSTQLPIAMDAVKTKASDLIGDASGPYARSRALEKGLAAGYLSDGGEGQAASDPGHYAARLADMLVNETSLVGDAEQYAALMAVMARQLGIPARVVLGVKPTAAGLVPTEVRGKDVTAWVEIGVDGVGWVPMFPTPESNRKVPQQQPKTTQNRQVQDPPKVVPPPRLDADASSAGTASAPPPVKPPAATGVPLVVLVTAGVVGVPLGLALVAATVVITLKSWRRSRRMRQGAPSARIAGGWSELLDLARDCGMVLPRTATRRELARRLVPESPGTTASGVPVMLVDALARRADSAVFAPEHPSEEEARAYWADVATARASVAGALGFWGRMRAAVSVRSLRAGVTRRR